MARAKQPQQEAPQDIDAIAEALQQLGDETAGCEVFLYQNAALNISGQKWGFIRRMPLSDLELGSLMEELRDSPEYGAGDYRVQVRAPGGQVLRSLVFTVGGRRRENTGGGLPAEILARADEKAEKARAESQNLLMVMMQQQAAQAQSTMQMFMAMMQQQSQQSMQMMQVLAGGKTDPAAMMASTMQTMAGMQNLLGGNKPAESLKEQLETFKAMRELMGDSGGGVADEGDGFMKMLTAFAPPILEAVAKGGAAPAAPVSVVSSAPTPRPPAARPVSPRPIPAPVSAPVAPAAKPAEIPNPYPEHSIYMEQLKRVEKLLALGATKSRDPEAYATLTLDAIDEQYHPQLFTLLEQPNWFAIFSAYLPSLAPHADFMAEVREAVMAELSGEEPEGDEEPDEAIQP